MGITVWSRIARIVRKRLFWRFFLSHAWILVALLLVSGTVNYIGSVRMINQQAEKANLLLLHNTATNMDNYLNSLRENSIDILNSPSLLYLSKQLQLKEPGSDFLLKDLDRVNAQVDLVKQLVNIYNYKGMVDSAYIYFKNSEYVVASSGSYSSSDFFHYYNRFPATEESGNALPSMFSSEKPLAFYPTTTISVLDPFTKEVVSKRNIIPFRIAYPFYEQPELFLVINLKEEVLKQSLATDDEADVTSAIMDQDGNLITISGLARELDHHKLAQLMQDKDQGSAAYLDKGQNATLTFVTSNVNHWTYLHLIDTQVLHRPAGVVQRITVILLPIFLLFGLIGAFFLSRKLYTPIQDIDSMLHRIGPQPPGGGAERDELSSIRSWSANMVERHQELNEQIGEMKPLLLEHLIIRLLRDEPGQSEDETVLPSIETIDPRVAQEEAWVAILLKVEPFECFREEFSQTDRSLMLHDLRRQLGAWPRTIHSASLEENLEVLVAGIDPLEHFHDAVQPLLNLMRQAVAPMQPIAKLTIGLGGPVGSLSHIGHSYRQAIAAMQGKSLTADMEVLEFDEERPGEPTDYFLAADQARKFANQVRDAAPEEAMLQIRQLLKQAEAEQLSARQLISFAQDVLYLLLRTAAEDLADDIVLNRYAELRNRLDHCLLPEELDTILVEGCNAFLKQNQPSKGRDDMFTEVVHYIHEHYDEPLSLDGFAEQYKMSLGHFSRSFKEAVGEKYVDYLSKVRLERAKGLLMDPAEPNLEEIARKVGLTSSKTLIALFKKYEGVTPGKFKAAGRR